MIRRVWLQASVPAVLLGLALLGGSLASVWSVSRLQANLARILSENVASLEAAQELEIRLRHLRLHALLYVLDPSPVRRQLVENDHRAFEAALALARTSAHTSDERRLVAEVEAGYGLYRRELGLASAPAGGRWQREQFLQWADAHPVRHLARPCQELLGLNKQAMAETAGESEALAERARWGMLALGLGGTAGGLLAGVGLARGLRRSVARLEVRVQDLRAQLPQEVATVQLPSGGSLAHLERQLDGVVGQVRDVVARVHAQQQEVLRAEQLAAVGRLAASVAHEVRNPLTAIKMLIGAAVRGPRPGLNQEDLEVMHGEVVRLERTVQNLLDFARPTEPQRRPTDLRDCVGGAVSLVRARAEQQSVAITVRQPESPVVAEVGADQVRAVLVNLFLNALDAMPQGGQLEIALEVGDRGRVRLAVRDNGVGIPPELLGKLFTPFVSSKATGTGLGLSICQRVARQHGGDVIGRNRPDGPGAEFVLTLPSCCDAR